MKTKIMKREKIKVKCDSCGFTKKTFRDRICGWMDLGIASYGKHNCTNLTFGNLLGRPVKQEKVDRKYELSKEGLRVGDIVRIKESEPRSVIVLEVLENIFCYSFVIGINPIYWIEYKQAILNDWTILQPEPKPSKSELKAKELLEKKGYKVEK
jgi:hypothetical protein